MLQGSLDNFALDEVLGLLSSTAKTGKLDLKGSRGKGALRLRQGRLVDATADNTANGTEPEDVLFELLRFVEGTFDFNVSDDEEGGYSHEVDEVLTAAEARLADWRTIEAVVPSLRHTIAPNASLPADEITISRLEWATLISIGGGCPVSTICEELGLGEVEGSRQIKGLAERGLVCISPPKGPSRHRRSGVDIMKGSSTTGLSTEIKTNDEAKRTARVEAMGPLDLSTTQFSSRRSPLPDAPTAEDRRADSGSTPPAPSVIRTDKASGNGNGTGNSSSSGEQTEIEETGGLMMRYLKTDD